MYREPIRAYHTLDHVREVVAAADELAAEARDRVAVGLAGFYHDVVYDPAAPDNEERSAALARQELSELGIDPSRAREVGRLVELTATHRAGTDDPDGRVLVDADLWILGAPPARYDEYRRSVRAEYRHLDDDAWREGRTGVVEALLDRPSLFGTRRGRRSREPSARHNLRQELEGLRSAR